MLLNTSLVDSTLSKELDQIIEFTGRFSDAYVSSLHANAVRLRNELENNGTMDLLFICTHNSRRSQFAQVWAAFFLAKYNIENMKAFSGGTAVTSVYPSVIKTLEEQGFSCVKDGNEVNPVYHISAGENELVSLYSKLFHESGSNKPKAAIMVCSHADDNCPFVPEAIARISLPFDDPKEFDNSELEAPKYMERSREIAASLHILLSNLKKLQG